MLAQRCGIIPPVYDVLLMRQVVVTKRVTSQAESCTFTAYALRYIVFEAQARLNQMEAD